MSEPSLYMTGGKTGSPRSLSQSLCSFYKGWIPAGDRKGPRLRMRRYVNLVTENYKTGMYSLHRLDIYKHLFHQSRADARVVIPSLLAGAHDHDKSCATGGDEQPVLKLNRLKELPTALTTWSSSNVDYFSLLGSFSGEGSILCLNKVGTAVLYDPLSSTNFIMPGLDEFKGGPVPLSLSVAPAAGDDGEEEQLFIMHGGGGTDGLELSFNVLTYDFLYAPQLRWCDDKGWNWRPLPVPPPFVLNNDRHNPQYKVRPAVISSYTVVDGGNGSTMICLSSVAADGGVGTYYLDTGSCDCEGCQWNAARCVGRQWKRAAGDRVLPFTGKAEYISQHNVWLGFSSGSPAGYQLCAASGLSDSMLIMDNNKPTMPPLIVWPDHTPKEWMPVDAKLLSLGAGRFAVAKVFKVVSSSSTEEDTAEADQVLVLSGVELDLRGNKEKNNLQGLKLLQHKAVCYSCANGTAISYVL